MVASAATRSVYFAWPGSDQGLVEQDFVIRVKSELSVYHCFVARVDCRPASHGAAPLFGKFGEYINPGPRVLAPFSVVSGSGEECVRPIFRDAGVMAMEVLH